MLIDVIGRLPWEQGCKSYGKVSAKGYQQAVEKVFSNRAVYPRITIEHAGHWTVEERVGLTGKINKIRVHCQRVVEEKAA